MLTGIDHFVVIAADLDVAIRNYTELGFSVVAGGKHSIGSHNALVPFSDGSYLELIAFTQPDAPHPWLQLLRKGGGIVDFCAQTDDLKGDLARFRKAGALMNDPMPMSRQRPDGYMLSWVLSIPQPPWSGTIPFLIEDVTPRNERVPRLTEHRNLVTGVGTITLAVSNLKSPGRFYETVLGQKGEAFDQPELDAVGLRFRIGPHGCALVAPARPSGPLAEWLKLRGPSPYAVTLKTESRALDRFDPGKSLNARLWPERSSSASKGRES
jgi:catechol 2,3-dioxygenase-like lactoylglutathione lyase family enzyme